MLCQCRKILAAVLFCGTAWQSPTAAGAVSIWVHDGDDLARLDFSTPTLATFSYIGKLGTGATGPGGTTWSDSAGPTQNAMIDIAWNADGTKLYGLSSARGGTNSADSYLWAINPQTGLATLVTPSGNGIPGDNTLPPNTLGRDQFTITNALGLAADGRMLTAIQTDRSIYSINLTNNTASYLGDFGNSTVARVSSGDIATFKGSTYLVAAPSPYLGGEGEANYLVSLDLGNLAASTVVGQLAPAFDAGWGLASTPDGLYAIDGNSKTVGLVNTATAALTAVTIVGDTGSLAHFAGGGSLPIPEATTAWLGLAAVVGLLGRRR